jgi:hypothetical protein
MSTSFLIWLQLQGHSHSDGITAKNSTQRECQKKRTNNPIIVVAIIKTNTCRMGMMKLERRTGKESKSSSMPNRDLAKECQQHRHNNNQMECKRIPSSIHHLL